MVVNSEQYKMIKASKEAFDRQKEILYTLKNAGQINPQAYAQMILKLEEEHDKRLKSVGLL